METYKFSEVVMRKTLDADFQTKMEGVQFSTTPREVVTVGHMLNFCTKLLDAEEGVL